VTSKTAALSHPRPGRLPVALAFTVSGFTSLVLEVVWSKALGQLLGSTLYSVSTVVAAYLGGLALGAWISGRFVQRLERPLRLYGMLEAGIGLYAVVSLALIHGLDPLVGKAYAALGPMSPVYLLVRVGFAALVLLPPTVLMGATLPALVSWSTRGGEDFGSSLGRLYGLNTLGAVAGAALSGFLLIPSLGLLATTRVAAAVAIVVGSSMFLIGSRAAASRAVQPEAAFAAGEAPHEPSRALALVLFGLSGAVALIFEITWARMFSLVFGSSVYSFALVLTSYLLALAIGSIVWGGRLADGARPWRAFAVLQIAAGAGAVAGLWALPHLPRIFLTVLMLHRQQLPVLFLLQTGLASLVTFLPCLAFGALFPVGTRLVAGGRMDGARATGVAYAVNTAGTLTGSLGAGFLLLPTIGVHATWVGSALLSLALGMAAWLVSRKRERVAATAAAPPKASAPAARGKTAKAAPARPARRPRATWDELIVPAAFVVALAAFFAPPWNRSLFTIGVFRTSFLLTGGLTTPQDALRNMDARLANDVLLFYREGLHSVVSVHGDRGSPEYRVLRVNGKPDASTSADISTQVLLGHVPMLWAPPHARVCVIGQGSGVTARAALNHDPERLTVVEIEPEVVKASHFFDAYNDSVLADPRVELILEDGRQHLLHSGRHYDVIVSEPSNPWIAGVNNLFTTDFYKRVKMALTPRGTFCQWVQFYELSQLAQSSLLASFAEVFPRGEAFLVNYDLLLVAPPEGGKVSGDRLFLRGTDSPVERYLHRFQLDGDGYVAGIHLGRVRNLVSHLPAAPLNTDDRPYIEYRAPIDLYQVPTVTEGWALAEPAPLAGLERWVDPAVLPRAAGAAGLVLAHLGQIDRAKEMAVELRRLGTSDATAASFDVATAATKAEMDRRIAAIADQGNKALDANDPDAAARAAQMLLRDDPDDPNGRLISARLAMRQDSLAEARRDLAVVLARGTTELQGAAHRNLGIIAMREKNVPLGRAEFEASRSMTPLEPMTYLYLARLQVQAGSRDSAEATLVKGIQKVVMDSQLRRALEALDQGQPF
jgi:spermidine synthase